MIRVHVEVEINIKNVTVTVNIALTEAFWILITESGGLIAESTAL